MCGIAGVARLSAATNMSETDLAATVCAMTRPLAHRGPDDAGTWLDKSAGIGLGHRRLSVVDLSAAGSQPMHSADGGLVISYNGEIYNAAELRAELEARGHVFRGHSDTEVIVEGCSGWGVERCVERLIGMFAFAVWNRRTRTLSLVRDRIGIKPLYWAELPNLLLFGSELKALRAHPGWTGEIDRDALLGYLRYGYIAAPRSIYRDVHKLEPGCLLIVRPGEPPRITRYWNLRKIAGTAARQDLDLSADAAVDHLARLLRDAVGRRMVADVPLGAFLSGGIDSSTVTALMQAQSDRPIRTFSIGFHEARFNEATHAKAIAAYLGTAHTELYVEPSDALAVIPRLPEWYDEPLADSSQIPTYLLAQMTRRDVTVALSGDGGDELFGGYSRYFRTVRLWRRFHWTPTLVWKAASRVTRAVPAAVWDRIFDVIQIPARIEPAGHRLHRAATTFASFDSSDAVYRHLVSLWPRPEEVVPGAREPKGILWDDTCAAEIPDSFSRMQLFDQLSYLPDNILAKVDRATMAVSLEARLPLLDHRVIEFACRVPTTLHLRDGKGKWLLRQVLYRHVPPALVERPKMGFTVPIDLWLRGPLRDWAEALLEPRRLEQEGWLRAEPVRIAWQRHLSGAYNEGYRLWTVLIFQAWLEHARGSLPGHADDRVLASGIA